MEEKYLKRNKAKVLSFARELKKDKQITEKQMLGVYYHNYII